MAVDYFLKIKGIEGESTDDKHKNEIDVLSWSWGESQSGSMAAGGGGGGGKVAMQDFNFVMKINKASPKLLRACALGEHVAEAVLVCRKAGKGQQEFLTIKLTDCIVSSFQTGGSAGSEFETDSISLNFAKINYEYKAQKADGTLDGAIKAGYDLKANKEV
jgi:type VI secretion system secreted protein Hcp